MLRVPFTSICAFICITFFSFGPALAETVCFECHEKSAFTGKVVHEPVVKGKCSACHNPHVAKHEDLLAFEENELCKKCHQKQMADFNKKIVHDPVEKGNCSACHIPHASDRKGLISADLAGDCFKCHEKLREEKNVTHKPFAEGKCLACHSPHNSDSLMLLTAENDALCWSCHEREQVEGKHKEFPMTVKNCLSCHNPHGSSRVSLMRDYLHKAYEKGCDNCHGPTGEVSSIDICLNCHEKTYEEMYATHSHFTRTEGNSCLYCHSPHAGDKSSLLKSKEKQVCLSCHLETLFKFKKRKYKHSGLNECSACHEPHGISRLAMLKGTGTEVCSGCHKSQGTFSHPIGPEVLDIRTGQVMTCVTCHNPMGTDYKYHLVKDGKEDLCILCHRTY